MIDLNAVKLLDEKDPLYSFKTLFFHQENEIYLDGNSLGKLPKKTILQLENTITMEWGKKLIRSWNENWIALPERLSKKYSTLLNVTPEEIVFGESTSVRLFQILYALLKSGNYGTNLITDNLNFPTDLYVLQGLKKHFPKVALTTIDYQQEVEATIEKLKAEIKLNPGIVCLSLVTYKSAYLYPLQELNAWAAKHQSIIVWDLSHAIGAVPIDFANSNTKIAVGCTYKYMNGGPGSPAFLYVKKELHQQIDNPIQGWFGHQKPFEFDSDYHAFDGLQRFQNGTPSILSMQAVEAGVDLVLEAGITKIREKSILQTEFLIENIKRELAPLGFQIQSPLNFEKRGSHIALSHSHAWQICQALIEGNPDTPKIIPDFRPPNMIRLGIAPLYTSFEDLWWAVNQLHSIVVSKTYLNFENAFNKVP